MKFLIVLLFALAYAKDDGLKAILQSPAKTAELYQKFKGEQHLAFAPAEDTLRFRLFKLNANFVASQNDVDGETAHFALNMFSTMTEAEKSGHLGLNTTGHMPQSSETVQVKRSSSNGTVPEEKLWTAEGKVTPVKDQGNCGACWSFAAVGGLETRYSLKAGILRNFAEQEYLHCVYDDEFMRDGCDGGWPDDCYSYSADKGRLARTSDLKYWPEFSICRSSRAGNSLIAAKITGTVSAGAGEANNIAALAEGSLSMALQATDRFQSYSSGILSDSTCSGTANHAVTGVGYTPEFILVKNSWGTKWGHFGFVKLARGYSPACRLFDYSSYPALSSTGHKDTGSDAATDYFPEDDGSLPCENTQYKDNAWLSCEYYQEHYGYCNYAFFVPGCKKECGACTNKRGECTNGVRCPNGSCRKEQFC